MSPEVDFGATNFTMDFTVNSIAVGVKVNDKSENHTQAYTDSIARVQFWYKTDFKDGVIKTTEIDAVYCQDLYSDQIEGEVSG